MSLLQDLQNIDLSAITEARGSIRAVLEGEDLRALIDGGAAQSALGELGIAIDTLQRAVEDPAGLLEPVAERLLEVVGSIDVDALPIDEYLDAIRQAVDVVRQLLAGLDGDPSKLGSIFGRSLGEALELAQAAIGAQEFVSLEDADAFRDLIAQAERGIDRSPVAFARYAASVLVPFPTTSLEQLRRGTDLLLEGSADLQLPAQATAELVAALDAVALASAGGSTADLEAALREIERVRVTTVGAIEGALTSVSSRLDDLGIDRILDTLSDASLSIQIRDIGPLEYLQRWRPFIAQIREQVDNVDPQVFINGLLNGMDVVERIARERIVEPVEEQIAALETWLRTLFRRLGLRRFRDEISGFVLSVADRIREADVGRFATEIRGVLDDIEQATSTPELGAQIRATLQDVVATINSAVASLEAELFKIVDAVRDTIESATEEIQRILGEAEAALDAFKEALESTSAAIDQLGIEAAGDEVIQKLIELRETAENLLAEAPLPDALRPVIEQLIGQIERLDLDAVLLDPVREAAERIQIPAEAGAFVNEALEAVSDVLRNLVPSQLVEELSAEFREALETLSSFDPTALVSAVTDYLGQAADLVRRLDPDPLPEAITAPFDRLLELFDRAKPSVLLAPVVEAYEDGLGSIGSSGPEEMAQSVSDLFERSIASAAGAVTAQVDHLVDGAGQAAEETRERAEASDAAAETPGETAPAASTPAAPVGDQDELYVDTFRPGDLVRQILGFLPQKIRELLQDVEASRAGELLGELDRLCGRLAADLLRVADALRDIEQQILDWLDDQLAPLAQASVRARLAVRAHVSTDGFDADAAALLVVQAGPGPLRESLNPLIHDTCGAARKSAGLLSGDVAVRLEQAAGILDGCLIARLGSDVDAFLEALDPEPIAAELDALTVAVLNRTPAVIEQAGDVLREAVARMKALIEDLNPGRQILRFLRLLDVIQDELNVIDPRRLAAELDEVHRALRDGIEVYNPAGFAREISEIVERLTDTLTSLDPAALLGDLADFGDLSTRLEGLDPAAALEGIGEGVEAVGERLAAIDPEALLESVNELAPRVAETFAEVADAIQREILTLLRTIRYVSGEVRVSAEVDGEAA